MKKYKKGIVIAIICLLFAFVAMRIYQEHFTKMHRMVYTAKDIYSPYMRLASVYIDEQNPDTIYIRFKMKEYIDESFYETHALYEKIVDVFLYDPDSPYQQYDLIICLDSFADEFLKIYVRDNGESLRLSMCVYDISFKEIAEQFPETTELYCSAPYFDNIEDLQGFDNLKELGLGIKLSEEEKEYIRSIYPDCYIDPRYIQDGVMYYDTEE